MIKVVKFYHIRVISIKNSVVWSQIGLGASIPSRGFQCPFGSQTCHEACVPVIVCPHKETQYNASQYSMSGKMFDRHSLSLGVFTPPKTGWLLGPGPPKHLTGSWFIRDNINKFHSSHRKFQFAVGVGILNAILFHNENHPLHFPHTIVACIIIYLSITWWKYK